MTYVRATTTAAAACLFVTVAAAQQPQAPGPSGAKLTAQEIFDHHTKQDVAGAADAGRPIFEKQCASCHRFGELGKDVGPDLTTIASRFKKSDLLEAILWPSKVISDQYQSEMFELSDGTVVTGVIVRESAIAVMVRTAANPDKPVAVPKGKIATRAASTVSLMPEGLIDGFSHAEIAGLLTFLLSPAPAK